MSLNARRPASSCASSGTHTTTCRSSIASSHTVSVRMTRDCRCSHNPRPCGMRRKLERSTPMRNIGLGRLAVLIAFAGLVVTSSIVQPVRAAVDSLMTCGSLSPCLEWVNSKNGDAVKGVSTNGSGLEGQTKFNSTGKSAGKAGVLGADNSTAGTLNAGVSGTSANGTGVTGQSTFANGVSGFTASAASGVYGQSASSGGFGVAGRNTSNLHGANGAGVLADGNTASDGLHAFAYGSSANAIYAFAQSGSAFVANESGAATGPEVLVEDRSGSPNKMIEADGPPGDVFDVGDYGDVNVSGTMTAGAITSKTSLSAEGIQTGGISMSGNLAIRSNANQIYGANGNQTPLLELFGGTSDTGSLEFYVGNSNNIAVLQLDDRGNMHLNGQLYTDGSCSGGCIVGGRRVRSVGEYAAVETEPTIEDNGEATLTNGVASVPLDPKFSNVIDPNTAYLEI